MTLNDMSEKEQDDWIIQGNIDYLKKVLNHEEKYKLIADLATIVEQHLSPNQLDMINGLLNDPNRTVSDIRSVADTLNLDPNIKGE